MTTRQAPARRWTPNERAFGLFVLVVILLLTFTVDDPLPVRIGRGIVRVFAWTTGIEIGALE